MKKHAMSEQERLELDQRIVEIEKRTGAQIVLAVIERSDIYAELPWKAFALGASCAGLTATAAALMRQGWFAYNAALYGVVATLATGAACALLCITVPAFARLFLQPVRAEVEVRQYAESLFLSREVFNTRDRIGIVLLISLFERQVVVLPDKGLRKRLSENIVQGIVARMATLLSMGQVAHAFEAGLDSLEVVLIPEARYSSPENELPNSIIEEKGI